MSKIIEKTNCEHIRKHLKKQKQSSKLNADEFEADL